MADDLSTPAHRRCAAFLPHRRRHCKRQALPGQDFCAQHSRREREAGAGRRCSARRSDGAPCGRWASKGSEPPVCFSHSKRAFPKGRDERRCRARKKDGARCRNWALLRAPDDDVRGGGLCVIHSQGPFVRHPTQADEEVARVCSATTLPGARCKKWVLPHTDPPLCSIHAYPGAASNLHHGFYDRRPALSDTERETILRLSAEGEPFSAEVALLRLKIRRLVAYTARPDLPEWRFLAAQRWLLPALRAVGRLLRAQQALRQEKGLPAPRHPQVRPSTHLWRRG
ncbi:MAG: CCCH zinc finger protein [Candidatus Promineifilaceae bacterium]|nr:CCCH zinc finger protein [Candidatus Promineifilaceae bacterium]